MSERIDPMTGEITGTDVVAIPNQMRLPQRSIVPTGFANIAKAIAGVMQDLTPVHKEGTHEHFKFKYAKMQDLMQELTPLLGKHGLAIIPTEIEKSWVDKQYVSVKYGFTIVHQSGEVWPERPEWTGMSLALTKNGSVDDKCLNKCATAARKYFLLALFNIPTADVDDADKGANDAQRLAPPPPPKATPGAKPHVIAISEGMDVPHWVNLYISYLSMAATGEELQAWDKLNDAVLTRVSNKDKPAYDRIVAATQKRAKEVSKKAGPPPPPKAQSDKDVELLTGGVTPPGETVREDPVDPQQWLRDFGGALAGCTTAEELEKVRADVGIPAKGKVPDDVWAQGGVLLKAAHNRIALEAEK
jgi:hypothetical protein